MHRRTFIKKTGLLTLAASNLPTKLLAQAPGRSLAMSLRPTVEVEDQIHSFEPADNGAGPLWCHGSTVVAREADEVYVACLETLPDHVPLNNCRWLLYRRTEDGWQLVHRDETGRTREPSPVARIGNGDLLVTANPTLAEPGQYSGPAEPAVFRFDTADIKAPPTRELPVWRDDPAFTEHSYRTVTADGDNGEVLYMQNVGYDVAHMSFFDRDGQWQAAGTITWPYGDEYEKPQPLRLCYPNVILRDRAAHYFGVGDIVEPVAAWQEAKFEITQRKWDYVFRRLFYAYTPDVASEPFCPWIEVANRDDTAGAMRNGDIYLDDNETAHLIWCETNTDSRLRDRFFPDETVINSLEYMTLQDGHVRTRRTLARVAENEDYLRPNLARFHVLEDGSLLVLGSFGRNLSSSDLPPLVYRMAVIPSDGGDLDWVDVPFAHPMSSTFLTNTVRGGSAPSSTIDLVCMSAEKGNTLGYARVRVEI